MKCGVISGTFDPITNGHFDLITRASRIFDRIIVAVSENTEKKCMFSKEARFEAVKAAFDGNGKIEVIMLKGILADTVKRENGVLVRGIRNSADYAYEEELYEINDEIAGVETVFLPAAKDTGFISSTFVRDMIIYNRNPEKYIPQASYEILKNEINNNKRN